MSEVVTVTPTAIGNDTNGDPLPQGKPVTLYPYEIEPGNATIKPGQGGELTDVEFTVYLPISDEAKIKNGDEIMVRGRRCIAIVQVWKSQRAPGMGGVVVLARSKSGKAA